MLSRIADRLKKEREQQMVGRSAEITLFENTLQSPELPFLLLHLSGPDGIGKTTLLNNFKAIAEKVGARTIAIDGRNGEPTPEAFAYLLRAMMGLSREDDVLQVLGEFEGRQVLLIDSYERLEPLDAWLRDVFIPQLSTETLVVLAGTQPLSLTWRSDPGWRELTHAVALRNLNREESIQYLSSRGVPTTLHGNILEFTHGYPLALSLVADMFDQKSEAQSMSEFAPENSPHIVQVLVERFIEQTPSPAFRSALEVASLVRITNEPLLAEILEGMDGIGAPETGITAHNLFQWLRGLSFMEAGPMGLSPHEMARDAILADLRWRNGERYAELHRRAHNFYNRRLEITQGSEQQRILYDFIFLHRDSPIVRSAFQWQGGASLQATPLRTNDVESLIEMVRDHEGEQAARIATMWLEEQPEGFTVFRDKGNSNSLEPVGFLFALGLQKVTPAQAETDPAASAALEFLRQNAPLRPGEVSTHFRFWMARDTYHEVSPVQSLIMVQMVRHYLTTKGLAYTFFPVRQPERWASIFAYAEIPRLPEVDFHTDGICYGIFGHDWRQIPPTTWLGILAAKESTADVENRQRAATRMATNTTPLLVLSEDDFASAVRHALRHLHDTEALRSNPLTRSRLVQEAGGDSSTTTLARLLVETVSALQNAPKLSRCYKPLYHTFVQPAPSQERAAELLDLPFSTFRRHLTEGVAEVTRHLWQQEIREGE
jgi:hypothetical protein